MKKDFYGSDFVPPHISDYPPTSEKTPSFRLKHLERLQRHCTDVLAAQTNVFGSQHRIFMMVSHREKKFSGKPAFSNRNCTAT